MLMLPPEIALAAKSTSLRDPVPAWRFVLTAAFRTAGTRPPFRSAEARNADVFTLVVEVLDVLALLLLGHPLVNHIPMRPPGALFWCALRSPTAARPRHLLHIFAASICASFNRLEVKLESPVSTTIRPV
jgi:hypothetical protein